MPPPAGQNLPRHCNATIAQRTFIPTGPHKHSLQIGPRCECASEGVVEPHARAGAKPCEWNSNKPPRARGKQRWAGRTSCAGIAREGANKSGARARPTALPQAIFALATHTTRGQLNCQSQTSLHTAQACVVKHGSVSNRSRVVHYLATSASPTD